MPRQPERYFFDNCLAPQLAAMLKALDVDALHIADVGEELPRDSADIDWMPWVAKSGRVAVTLDNRIATRPHEKKILQETQLRVVFLAKGVANLDFWAQARFLINQWQKIEASVERLKPGRCVRVTMRGSVEDI
jgi:predicted nuclease of predicted toxin-antitoxin system